MFDDMRQAVKEIMESDWIEQICQSEHKEKSEIEESDISDALQDWEWRQKDE